MKIIIIPSCDDANRGDQALVWETIRLAKRAGQDGEFSMLSTTTAQSCQTEDEGVGLVSPILRHPSERYPAKDNLRYGVKLTTAWGLISLMDVVWTSLLLIPGVRSVIARFLKPETRLTLQRFREADLFLVKGGGFIHSTGSVADPYKAYYFLYHVMLAKTLHKRVCVMPNSFGPFEGRVFRTIVKFVLKRCDIVTCREGISQQMLRDIGIEAPVFPDLGFGLVADPLPDSPIDRIRHRNRSQPLVGITVRPYRFPGSADPAAAYQRYIHEMASLVTRISDSGCVPVLIEHVLASGAHESDMEAISRVRELLDPRVAYGEVSIPGANCRQIKSLYGACDYVIGTRFHSVIFALSEGTPALAVAYGGNKGMGIMSDLGLERYAMPIEDFSAEIAWTAYESLRRDTELPQYLKSLQPRRDSDYQRLADLIST